MAPRARTPASGSVAGAASAAQQCRRKATEASGRVFCLWGRLERGSKSDLNGKLQTRSFVFHFFVPFSSIIFYKRRVGCLIVRMCNKSVSELFGVTVVSHIIGHSKT